MLARMDSFMVRSGPEVEGFRGWVAFAGSERRLTAGGLRVQPGLTQETLVALAGAMTLKERLLGLGVDGAKAGIDYDPWSPGKHEALVRFLRFLREAFTESAHRPRRAPRLRRLSITVLVH